MESVRIGSSKINGTGVFAEKNFLPWETVLVWDVSHTISQAQFDKLSEDEKRYINQIEGEYIVMQSPAKYVNHSCDPNTKVRWFSDVAVRHIRKDEEITSSYVGETTLLAKTPTVCNCGAKNCTGFIQNSPHPSPLLKGEGIHSPSAKNGWNPTKEDDGVIPPSPRRRGVGGEVSAFTLVELLVVITIIAITSVAAISGFSRLGDAEENRTIALRVEDTISELDHAIDAHRIASYEIVFQSGSLSYRVDRDAYGRTDRMIVTSYDESTLSWSLSLVSTATGTWQVALWRDDRFQSGLAGSTNGSLSFSFSGDMSIDRYDVSGVVGTQNLNSLSWIYYSGENVWSATEKQIRLTTISWSTLSYPTLILRNVLGKKELYGSDTSLDSLTGAMLTLEKNGKEVIVSIYK